MENCEALVMGGSAGSLDVLLKILPDINPLLSFPIIIVLHRKPGKDSILTDLLAARTQLNVKELEEKDSISAKTIYIAPPNYHTLIEKNKTFSLDASEKVNFSRPSIDVTFESAADVYKENLAALLLSGANSDGSFGLQKIKEYGGLTIVQQPSSAVASYMPDYAIRHVSTNAVLHTDQMADYINKLSK